MKIKVLSYLATILTTIVAMHSPASAAFIKSSFGGTVIDFDPPTPFNFTSGPVQIGTDVGLDITWESTTTSVIGTGDYGLGQNGTWNSERGGFTGLDASTGAMTFTFNDGPVSSVGGFINYSLLSSDSPDGENPIIELLGASGNVLESKDLFATAPISTPGVFNDGAFRGFSRTNADIQAFRLSNSFIVLDDLEFATNRVESVPEPATIIGSLFALGFGGILQRRKKLTSKR